jgi:hypothetical protein
MKPLILILFLTVSSASFAQLNVGVELGGSNFLGYALNIEPHITLNETSSLSVKAGLGGLFPGWPLVPTSLYQFGLHYNYKNWGIGADASAFTVSPFSNAPSNQIDVDLIVYPCIEYCWKFDNGYFLNFSADAYFAYDNVGAFQDSPSSLDYQWQGDVIPGVGITFGGIFHK